MTTGQQLIQQGRALGREEGLQKGLQKGRQETLRRLLVRRFGPLPADAVARLNAATVDELDGWLDRLLVARSLDEVFDGA